MAEFFIPERALVIVAHADDIEFGVSGTVARWTEAGAQVTYCIVTDNSSGSNDPAMKSDDLIEIRRLEQIASAEAVGVTDVRFLNYKDGTLTPTLELRRDLTRVVRDVRPQIVITFDPTTILTMENNYINHPDHRATGEAAVYAVFPSSESRPIFPELLAEGYEPHKVQQLYLVLTNQPNLTVDVSATHGLKLDALRAHKSQVGEEEFEMVKQWDAASGEAEGYAYAEVFRVMKLNEPEPVS
ncbi:MAG: PIG-L family deacetylase [Anaerolineae bacterium]|nr:PIG-L family deacetylase [Anaerolineae bacterium]